MAEAFGRVIGGYRRVAIGSDARQVTLHLPNQPTGHNNESLSTVVAALVPPEMLRQIRPGDAFFMHGRFSPSTVTPAPLDRTQPS